MIPRDRRHAASSTITTNTTSTTIATIAICLATALVVLGLTTQAMAQSGAPRNAAAPPQQPVAWNVYDDIMPREDVPLDGIIAIDAQLRDFTQSLTHEEALGYVDVTVTDPEGTVLTGTLTYEPELLAVVWRGDAQFEPETTYGVEAFFDNTAMATDYSDIQSDSNVDLVFTATTSNELATELPAPTIDSITLVESNDGCCVGGECPPSADVTFAAPDPNAGHTAFTYELKTSEEQLVGGYCNVFGDGTGNCQFGARAQDEYCVTLTVDDALSEPQSVTQCASAETISEAPETDNTCLNNGGSEDGCNIAGTRTAGGQTSAGLLMAALALLGLVLLRRRGAV